MIKHVLDTNNLGLEIEPTEDDDKPWKIVCFRNSIFAGELVSRRSISGFILNVLGVLVS